MQRTAGRDR